MPPSTPNRLFAGAIMATTISCASRPSSVPATAPLARATHIIYGPGESHYMLTSRLHVEQTFSGRVQPSDTRVGLSMTVSLEADSAGLRARLVVDSVSRDDMSAIGLSGATFSALLTTGGEVTELTQEAGPTIPAELANALRIFFPRLPRGGLAPQSVWVDTTDARREVGGGNVAIHGISRHTAGAWVEERGHRALPISSEGEYTLSGTGSQSGMAFSISGDGRRASRTSISADGRYLGGSVADTSTATVTLTAIGASIPIRQVRSDSVVLIR